MKFNVKDHYFKKAKQENYLARSIYKLSEIDQKYKIFHHKQYVLDLGYHPGSWTQYALTKLSPTGGFLIGVDIKEANKTHPDFLKSNCALLKYDIESITSTSDLCNEVVKVFGDSKKNPHKNMLFDLVLSDMAPSTTGIQMVDQAGSLNLIERVFYLIPQLLAPKGNLVLKVFDGPNAHNTIKLYKNCFEELSFFRPKSTRSCSKEFFVIAKGFIPRNFKTS